MEALSEIYRHYVERTAVTFEYEAPSAAAFAARAEETQLRYPFFAAEKEGRLLGYAYAGPFHPRIAYVRSSELTIYLAPDARGKGTGRMLYAALEEALRRMGVLNLYACIAVPEQADEYLDFSSEAFHTAMGFRRAGFFENCGYKFGRWYHMIWMEKMIGSHGESPAPFTPFPELRDAFWEKQRRFSECWTR